MAELGMQIAQQYLRPTDKLIGVIGDAGSGKSMLVKGMFPGLELTNDDEGVNVRPLPLLEMLDDPLGMGSISKKGFSLFATPHTYHLDIRFEQGFTQCPELARAIMAAIQKGKRVVVEHFDLVYPSSKGKEVPAGQRGSDAWRRGRGHRNPTGPVWTNPAGHCQHRL